LDCIGGYTKISWSSDGRKIISDPDAMLFNLTRSRHFPSKGTGYEIEVGSAPTFGGGKDSELEPWIAQFNLYECCVSRTNGPCFGIPRVNGINMLTNMRKNFFSISELEVWSVKEVKL
jgi:hypothetical protein